MQVFTNVSFALVEWATPDLTPRPNLSLSASIGFIALLGIAVLNGVVLVTHLNDVRKTTDDLDEAVRIGSTDRLRPVLMTALVASPRSVPMALSASPGKIGSA